MRSLSVVVPAYNEEANLEKCISAVNAVLKDLKIESEIIVVDDGSKDKTGQIADQLAKKHKHLKVVHNNPNRGYGGSLKAGFAAASKDWIAFVPADNQFDFSEIKLMISKQEETGADIISGIRADRHDPLHRKIIGWTWNSIVRAMFGFLASDIDCGFKMFRRDILQSVTIPAEKGAMIDTQLFAGARARGFTVAEVELTHLPRVSGNGTGVNVDVMIQSFIDLFKFWWGLRQEILVEKGLAVFRWEFLLMLVVLAISAFVRLYKIDQYMTFLGDEGRDVIIVRELVLGHHIPFIGPGTSVGNMYLGPWYYYLMAPALALSGLSPVGPAMMVAMFGLATIWLIWWAGRQWFGRQAALAVSLLYSLSPVVITYSRSSWNPNIMPFFALLLIYAIWKVWKYHYWRWLVIAAAAFGFVINSHYLGLLLLFPAAIVFLSIFRLKNWGKHFWAAVLVFVLMMSPLVIFDLNPAHRFQNIGNIVHFFSDRQTTVNLKFYKSLPNIWPLSVQITQSLMTDHLNDWLTYFVIAVMAVFAIFATATRKINKDLAIVLLWIAGGLIGMGLYKQHIYDHYFGFLFPAPFLLLGFVFQRIKYWAVAIFIVILAVEVYTSPLRYPPNNQLRHTQEVDQFLLDKSAGQPFNFALVSKRNYDKSYVYFLTDKNRGLYTLHDKMTEQLFVVCEDQECPVINNPLWEVAAFGWAKIDSQWSFPWGVKLFKLVHNPSGKL